MNCTKHITLAALAATMLATTAFTARVDFTEGTFRTTYSDASQSPHVINNPPIGRCIPLYTPSETSGVANDTNAHAHVYNNEYCIAGKDTVNLAPGESAVGTTHQAVMFFFRH